MNTKRNHKFLYTSIIYAMIVFLMILVYGLYMQLSFAHSQSVLSYEVFESTGGQVGAAMGNDYEMFKNQNQDVIPTLHHEDIKIADLKIMDIRKGYDVSNVLNPNDFYVFYQNDNQIGYVLLDSYFSFSIHASKNYLFVNQSGNILYQMETIGYTSIYAYVERFTSFDVSKTLENNLLNKQAGNLGKRVNNAYLSYKYIAEDIYIIELDSYLYQNSIYQPFYAGLIVFSIAMLAAFIAIYFFYVRPSFKHSIESDSFLIPNSHVMLLILDKKGYVRKYNTTFYQTFGKQYIFKTIFDYTKEVFDLADRKTITIKLSNQHRPYHFMILSFSEGYVLVSDHAEKELGNHYKNLALNDMITGLPNRIALEEDLINHHRLQEKSGLIVLDVKDYRQITKMIGYPKAQKLLNRLKEQIQSYSKDYQMKIYNFNHDIFVIWLNQIAGLETLEIWAKGFLNYIAEPFLVDDEYIKVDIKMGIVKLFPGDKIQRSSDVVNALMGALERAKNSSIYHYVIYDDGMSGYLSKHQMMERDLKKAILNDEFIIYLQPQYDFLNKRTIGFEALLRWNNPLYIKESPMTYIEMAERNSMIVDIGKIIMKKVFETSMLPEFKAYKFSFNVSPHQMMQRGFIGDLIALAESYQIDYDRISIEVTETMLAQSLELMIHKIEQLKSYGFEVHLDDFGTGYSSLSYLKSLPLDVVKIDKQFVDHITNDRADRILIEAIIDLVKNLDLGLIIEGVETTEQAELLSKFKAYILQGYLISQPISLEQAKKFINKK